MNQVTCGKDVYSFHERLANTIYGWVHRAKGSSGEEFCSKTCSKSKMMCSHCLCEVPLNEVKISFALEHENLLSLLDTINDGGYVHCVFEYLGIIRKTYYCKLSVLAATQTRFPLPA